MSWDAAKAWRDALRATDPARVPTHLSPEGLREGWTAALDALTDQALADAAAIPGVPFRDAVVVCAGTVPTAPIEWCAVLLGRGTRVHLKHHRNDPGVIPLLLEAAAHAGLPLTADDVRDRVRHAELIAVMGSDATVAAVRAQAPPDAIVLAHGHRFSVIWVADARPDWDAVAADAALYDGRGCLSPVVVFAHAPLGDAVRGLGEAMARAEARWPRGAVDDAEGAAIRRRRALARTVGAVAEAPTWSVHGLPAEHWMPEALPRSVAVVTVPHATAAAAVLEPWRRALSTVGTDAVGTAATWHRLGASRVCTLGSMQRPPLRRAHDGIDWVAHTIRATSTDT